MDARHPAAYRGAAGRKGDDSFPPSVTTSPSGRVRTKSAVHSTPDALKLNVTVNTLPVIVRGSSAMLIRGPRHVRARGLGDRPEGESAPRITVTEETPLPALLDDLLDAVSVGIVVQRPDGEPLWVNTAARALLGPDPVGTLATAAAGALRRGRLQQTVLDLGPYERSEGAHRGADDEPSEVLVTTVPIAPYGGPVAALVSTVSAEADRPTDPGGDRPGTADNGRLQRALLRAEQHMLALTEHASTGLAASPSTAGSCTRTPRSPRCSGGRPASSSAPTCRTSTAPTARPRRPCWNASPPARASGSTSSAATSGRAGRRSGDRSRSSPSPTTAAVPGTP